MTKFIFQCPRGAPVVVCRGRPRKLARQASVAPARTDRSISRGRLAAAGRRALSQGRTAVWTRRWVTQLQRLLLDISIAKSCGPAVTWGRTYTTE